MSVGRYSSGGPFEEQFGYSRLVVAGPHAYCSGSTAVVDGIVNHEGDPYNQALTAFNVALKALSEAGFDREDVESAFDGTELAPEIADRIVRLAGGTPMVLSLLARFAHYEADVERLVARLENVPARGRLYPRTV